MMRIFCGSLLPGILILSYGSYAVAQSATRHAGEAYRSQNSDYNRHVKQLFSKLKEMNWTEDLKSGRQYKTDDEVIENDFDQAPKSEPLAKTFLPDSGISLVTNRPIIHAIQQEPEITMEMRTIPGESAPDMIGTQLENFFTEENKKISSETPSLILPAALTATSDSSTSMISSMSNDLKRLVDDVATIKKVVIKLYEQSDRDRRKKRKNPYHKQKVSGTTGVVDRLPMPNSAPIIHTWKELNQFSDLKL